MADRAGGARPAVVISGASSGIGRACALRLAAAGYRVFAGVRMEADGAALRQEAGAAVTPLSLDVTDAASIAASAAAVRDATADAGLYGLVNNAGITVPGPLELVSVDALRRQLEVNVIGHVAVTQALLPLLRMRRGRIVNVGSISGLLAVPFLGSYAASKYALEAVSDVLRRELSHWHMAVSIVDPGNVATPIWQKGAREVADLRTRLDTDQRRLYAWALPVLEQLADRLAEGAQPPAAIAAVVQRALTARRPRPRYVVGRRARVQAVIARLLPARLVDALLLRALGIHAVAGDLRSRPTEEPPG